jgi:hypothetical protein
MSLSAVPPVSPVEAIVWPGMIAPVQRQLPAGQRGPGGKSAPSTPDDTYVPGELTPGLGSRQLPSYSANLAALAAGTSTGSVQDSVKLSGIPQPLLNGLRSPSLQTQKGTAPQLASLLSELGAAIGSAAQDGAQDTYWIDDLVGYAGGLGAGMRSTGSSTAASGALASDLNTLQSVIQQLTAQVSSALLSKGASASQVGAAVHALTTSLTLDSLGAVAQQIAARTGSQNTFTVTSSVVTISTNGSSASVSQAGETQTFSGSNGSLALTTTGGAASRSGTGQAAENATGSISNLTAQGSGYSFSIAENGPDGTQFAATSEASATAQAASGDGSGASVNASAAVEQSSTVYEDQTASGPDGGSKALVLLSDWQAGLESSAAAQASATNSVRDAQQSPAPASAPTPASVPAQTLADSVNTMAYALFKQALALLEGILGWGNGSSAANTGKGNNVDLYV